MLLAKWELLSKEATVAEQTTRYRKPGRSRAG